MSAATTDLSGMTVNERLSATRLLADWDAAIAAGDRDAAIALLGLVELASQAEQIVDTVLANRERYGFRG